MSGRLKLQAAGAALVLLAGAWLLRRTVASFDLEGTSPERGVIRDLSSLRLAVWEYYETNRRYPQSLEEALMAVPSRPMRELPKSAKWGYRPEDGHVFVDSTHTDSRGNRWDAY